MVVSQAAVHQQQQPPAYGQAPAGYAMPPGEQDTNRHTRNLQPPPPSVSRRTSPTGYVAVPQQAAVPANQGPAFQNAPPPGFEMPPPQYFAEKDGNIQQKMY